GPAVLSRARRIDEADFPGVLEDIHQELRVPVALRGDRDDLLLREPTGRVDERLLFLRQLKIDHAVPPRLPPPRKLALSCSTVSEKGSFFRPVIRSMSGYVPGEQPRDRRYIKLNTNENPYPPSPRVLEALRAAATADLRLYPDPDATELRQKAAEVYGVPFEGIIAGNGSDDLL